MSGLDILIYKARRKRVLSYVYVSKKKLGASDAI